MKNTLSEMKNTLERINSRLDEAEDQISDLEDKIAENTQSELQKGKMEGSLRYLWDNIKCNNICIIRVPETEENVQRIKNLFEEIMTENFLKLVKEKDIQVQEVWRVSNKINLKRPTPKHIMTKIPKVKDKEKILRAGRETQLPTRELPVRLT